MVDIIHAYLKKIENLKNKVELGCKNLLNKFG